MSVDKNGFKLTECGNRADSDSRSWSSELLLDTPARQRFPAPKLISPSSLFLPLKPPCSCHDRPLLAKTSRPGVIGAQRLEVTRARPVTERYRDTLATLLGTWRYLGDLVASSQASRSLLPGSPRQTLLLSSWRLSSLPIVRDQRCILVIGPFAVFEPPHYCQAPRHACQLRSVTAISFLVTSLGSKGSQSV